MASAERAAAQLHVRAPNSRVPSLRTLRRLRAWAGPFGAAYGRLVGITSLLPNHRALLRIRGGEMEVRVTRAQLVHPLAFPEGALRFRRA